MPKYSFIVPVYNCSEYLLPCVDSLLNQSFKDFEILLVDDGSRDGSGELCDRLAGEHACIRAFHKENGGAASARNFGMDQAAGEFLLFIDGDDTIEPDTLSHIEATPACDLIIFGMAFDYYGVDNTLLRTEHLSSSLHGPKEKSYLIDYFRALFQDNALSSACNKVFSARIIREQGLRFPEDMTMYEDLEFVLRYLSFTDTFCGIPAALYHYRIDAQNFGTKRVHQLEQMQNNLHRLGQTLLTMEPLPAEAPSLMANLYLQFLLRHLLVSKYRVGKLDPVYRYCEAPVFHRSLELGGLVEGQEGVLLEMIKNRAERQLVIWLRKKKTVIYIRKTAKRMLRALGLRR